MPLWYLSVCEISYRSHSVSCDVFYKSRNIAWRTAFLPYSVMPFIYGGGSHTMDQMPMAVEQQPAERSISTHVFELSQFSSYEKHGIRRSARAAWLAPIHRWPAFREFGAHCFLLSYFLFSFYFHFSGYLLVILARLRETTMKCCDNNVI